MPEKIFSFTKTMVAATEKIFSTTKTNVAPPATIVSVMQKILSGAETIVSVMKMFCVPSTNRITNGKIVFMVKKIFSIEKTMVSGIKSLFFVMQTISLKTETIITAAQKIVLMLGKIHEGGNCEKMLENLLSVPACSHH
jgi:hypothetical protein